MTCTFFGHQTTPGSIYPLLHTIIIDNIERFRVDKFYVGNDGNFDEMATQALKEIKRLYTFIEYYVVPAYLPNGGTRFYHPTEFPEGIENTPKELAADFRNKWMLSKADIVIAYVTHSCGNAAKFIGQAKRDRKVIINLSGVDIGPF